MKEIFASGALVMLLMGAAGLSFGAGVDPLAGEPEGERIALWPEGQAPNAEPHQYANPFIEWFVPYYKPGKIEVRHSDAVGKALALKALGQIATPKNTGVLYIPKGTIRYGRPRNAAGAASN